MKTIQQKLKWIAPFLCFIIFIIISCSKDSDTNLSAARDLEGIWTTTFPVKFFIQTDFCSEKLQDVATENRSITWEIENVDDNTVFITVNFTTSNFEIVNENCNPTGYVPDISLLFLHGSISSSGLTVSEYDNESNVLGEFTFTTNLIQGTWVDSWCIAYCQRVYTATNQYKLDNL